MSIEDISRARGRQERAKEATGHVPEGEYADSEPDSLATIFADKEKQALFGKLLKSDIADQNELDEMYRKLGAKEALTPGELDFLDKERYVFAEAMKMSEEAVSTFGTEEVETLADRHPNFAMFVGQVGAERAAELLRVQFPSLAVTDPVGIRNILKDHEAIEERKKSPEYQRTNKEVEKLCKRHDFSPENIAAVLAIPRKADRESKLKELVRERYGTFRKGIDYVTSLVGEVQFLGIKLNGAGGMSSEAARSAMDVLKRMEKSAAVKEIERHMKNIGDVLASATLGDAQFIAALGQEVLGGDKVSREKLEGVTSAAEMKTKKEALTEASITGPLWTQEKARLEKFHRKAWRNFTNPEKDAARDNYLSKVERENKPEGSGVFASILFALLSVLFADLKAKKVGKLA